MGLREWLARQATGRAHVLVVEAPAGWRVRAAVEREVLERGWVLAASPADADVLAVCGPAGPEVAAAVEHVWGQLPGPRARVEVGRAEQVRDALERAAARLADSRSQDEEAAGRTDGPGQPHQREEEQHGGHEEHGGHGEHGGMDMAPDGIPLAQGGEDRDGLEMDVLHMRLGPVLPYWPAGLVLRCSLHGDVVGHAEVELLDHATTEPAPAGAVATARRCDSIAALLALAGWDDAAALARRGRDHLLTPRPDVASAGAGLRLLHRKVTRSPLLRWSLRGVGQVDDRDLARHRLPASLRGDAYDRLVLMVERSRDEVGRSGSGDRSGAPAAGRGGRETVPVDAVPHLLAGLDLGTARLVVASLGPDAWLVDHEAAHA